MNYHVESALISFLWLAGVNADNFSDKIENGHAEHKPYTTIPGCYDMFVGSKGSIQNPGFPRTYLYSISCEWDIDVTRGYAIVLEFEVFRLPISKEQRCDSFIEVSHADQQEGVVKRHFCPTDKVDRFYTESQTAHIRFKSGMYHEVYGNQTYGFKVNYRAAAVSKAIGNHAITVVLLSTFAAACVIALCVCCFRGRHKDNRNAQITNNIVTSREPNASTRSEPVSTFEFQRYITQTPQKEQKYLSRISSVNSSIAPTKDVRNFNGHTSAPQLQENWKMSITTTPKQPIWKWSSESARRIQRLRSRLVARFSSHSSPDISVFFDAPDRSSYSQLRCEDTSPDQLSKEDKRVSISDLNSLPSMTMEVPSIVIELVE